MTTAIKANDVLTIQRKTLGKRELKNKSLVQKRIVSVHPMSDRAFNVIMEGNKHAHISFGEFSNTICYAGKRCSFYSIKAINGKAI